MISDFLLESLICFLIAFLLTLLGTKLWLKLSIEKNWGQPIREEGNVAHYKKKGTPTMGGVVFTIVYLVVLFIFAPLKDMQLFILILSCLGFFLIGLLDDWKKVQKKENEGLTPKQKLILQFVLAGLLVILAFYNNPDLTGQYLIFFRNPVELGFFWIPIDMFIIVGTVNAVNLTDGLDGLCTGVSLPVFLSIAFLASLWDGPYAVGSLAAMIFAGALLGFLFFNAHPAQLFMGDAGSMAIGGAIIGILLIYGRLVSLIILGGIYLIEALSDIIQMLYFRKTGGKRFFRMAPIHHHFELGGMAEEKVAIRFSIVSLILCLISIIIH